VSRVGGRENLISRTSRSAALATLAKEKKLRVGKVLTDLDESGGKWERPGLAGGARARAAGEVGRLDRRVARSSVARLGARAPSRAELAEAGATIYAPDAPADWTSPEGELQAGIVFTFAQYVRKRARAGFERSKEQAIARGIPVELARPVGYVKGDDRRLEPDPRSHRSSARCSSAARLAPGRASSPTSSKRGVKTSQGSASWSKQAVRR
jgi:DNA invertase Pin-like site-specific DNA recombinase